MSATRVPYPLERLVDEVRARYGAGMDNADGSVTLVVGQPWLLTSVYKGPGVNGQWIDPYMLVIVNGEQADPRLDRDLNPRAPLKLGLAQFENMPVFLIRSPAFGTLDIAHPWIAGAPEPEIVPIDASHILWNLVIVQEGHISSMHAFTTTPHMTTVARRIFAEQRSAGPLTVAQAQAAVDRWQQSTHSERDIWRRALATGKPGD